MGASLESRNLRSLFGCCSFPLGPEKNSLYRLLPTMATSSAALSITTGGSYFDSCNLQSNKFKKLGNCQSQLAMRQNPIRRRNLSVRAEYGDASRGDDVVGEFQNEVLLQRRAPSRNRMVRLVCDFFSRCNSVVFRYKMSHNINVVRKRLDEIAEERRNFHLAERSASNRLNERETSSFVIESEVLGRDEDREKVIHFLIDTDNDKDVSVLPIVGLGGVGKTTLAQLVYNDERIERQFELHVWVCVSEIFDVAVITRKLFECVTGKACNMLNLQSMQQQLRKELSVKRFMIVFDDVWNEDEAEWERLRPMFKGGVLGNKIMVTTRSDIVARIMGTAAPHQLKGLPADVCWTLFRRRAFGMGREKETPRLVDIGKEIVSKCGGLPLAAKALGSLMSCRRGEAEWLAVKNSEIWELPLEDTNILPALMLSYDHLPSQLKQCFAYCSLFPKDYVIDTERLIGLWIAEGFIPLSDEGAFAEDIGNRYFNSLLWRSFFQDEETDNFGNVVRCKMHDLVHDLACHVAGDEILAMEVGRKRTVPHTCRYISAVNVSYRSNIPKATYQAKKLRTFILLGKSEIDLDLMSTHLRILDLSNTGIIWLPDILDKFKHLRFLDLSGNGIETLPNSVTTLPNLLMLNLSYCVSLQQLPQGISSMVSLRYLDILGCFSLTSMPCGMGRLSKLQKLPMFIVGTESVHSITELRHLDLVGGILQIKDLHNVKDPTEAIQANMRAKTNLQSLELWWEGAPATEENVEADVLENLEPPDNLRNLTIRGYGGMRFPSWMQAMEPSSHSRFTALVEIKLDGLSRCEHLPPLGQLPFLKSLYIVGMGAVRRFGRELYGDTGTFPSLEMLELRDMPNLEEWSMESAVTGEDLKPTFPCLEFLRIVKCPMLLSIQPCIPSTIVELKIESSNEELLSGRSLVGLSKLRKLQIRDCRVSSSTTSSSSWCWEGLQCLTTIEELTIEGCHQLTYLPEGIMTHHIPSLRTLHLLWNTNLMSLGGGGGGERGSEGLQQQAPLFFSGLHHLEIHGCNTLTALPEWLGSLTSLRILKFLLCLNLERLPDGLQHLTTLKELHIIGCPLLERRCMWQRGEDWHKIAHIPYTRICK